MTGSLLPMVDGGFRTIVADPPWSYENWTAAARVDSGAVTSQYSTMTQDELLALPVRDVAAKDCLLLLWATNPKMPDAFALLDAWGFRHKTMMTWCKPSPAIGFWLRSQTEHVIIATKGSPPTPEKGLAPGSVFHAPRTGHSAKPRGFYPIAERLGLAPRLEIFARERRHGWASFGNQLSATAESAISDFHPEEA